MMDISVETDEGEEQHHEPQEGDEVVSNFPDMEVDEDMVALVAKQGDVSEHRAKVALQNEKGDVISALMVNKWASSEKKW